MVNDRVVGEATATPKSDVQFGYDQHKSRFAERPFSVFTENVVPRFRITPNGGCYTKDVLA